MRVRNHDDVHDNHDDVHDNHDVHDAAKMLRRGI